MKWKIDFKIDSINSPANYQDKMLIAGSCFAENIGRFLIKYKFDALINPHGILHNPASLVATLDVCLMNQKYTESDLFFDHGLWHSWDHHESFSNVDKSRCLRNINSSVEKAHEQFNQADWLILTFGSAGIYRLIAEGRIVSNCHKRPASEFDYYLMPPEKVISILDDFIQRLFEQNRKIKIVFTVSPVRYVRYGLTESNLSKAVLLYAVHELVKKYERLYYFPSYEIVIDELRDYRFYGEDLAHPSPQASQYVWDRFAEYFMSAEAKSILETIKDIIQSAGHRPLHPASGEYKKFAEAQLKRVENIEKDYPFINFEPEKEKFKMPFARE
jgi:hypothetical protein